MYNHEPSRDSESSNDQLIGELFSQRCADDPVTVYHEVQAQCPVHRGPGMLGGNKN